MKRAVLPFGLLIAMAALALFVKTTPKPLPDNGDIVAGDVAWMLTSSALVLLMTPGLMYFYGGMVSFKNVVSTMLQSIIALGVISLVWVTVGFGLAFGSDVGRWGIIGNPMDFFLFDNVGQATFKMGKDSNLAFTVPLLVFAMFQLKFAIITPALITGSFAERVRFSSYLLFMVLFSLLIYCPLAHMTWHPDGKFFVWGVKDFAGGTVVHMSAGFAALAGAMILGGRESHRAKHTHDPANIPYVLMGTGLLWFGWFGFNAGSAGAANGTAALAFTTTNTAAAAAMLAWIFMDWMLGKKPSAMGACIGAVVGLVAITPAAGYVDVRSSVVIGLVASAISNLAVMYRTKSGLDDTLDVFPCHGIGGLTGMVCTAIFADLSAPGSLTRIELLMAHGKALLIVVALAFFGSLILYKLVDLIIPLRVTPEQETEGLDLSQHGETALAASLFNGGLNGNGNGNGNGHANGHSKPAGEYVATH